MPWDDLPDDEPKHRPIGVWERRHLRFIMQHSRALYTELLISGKLNDYLADLNDEAGKMFSRLAEQIALAESITEQFKIENQIEWVGRINSVRDRATEMVIRDLTCQ